MKQVGFLFFFLFSALSLYSQSNSVIDDILAEKRLSPESAAYLLLSARDVENPPAGRGEALEKYPQSLSGFGQYVEAGEFALLLQDTFDLPKGLWGHFFPSPRYAFRDLKFLDIIQERLHPNSDLSGESALRILSRLLEKQGDEA